MDSTDSAPVRPAKAPTLPKSAARKAMPPVAVSPGQSLVLSLTLSLPEGTKLTEEAPSSWALSAEGETKSIHCYKCHVNVIIRFILHMKVKPSLGLVNACCTLEGFQITDAGPHTWRLFKRQVCGPASVIWQQGLLGRSGRLTLNLLNYKSSFACFMWFLPMTVAVFSSFTMTLFCSRWEPLHLSYKALFWSVICQKYNGSEWYLTFMSFSLCNNPHWGFTVLCWGMERSVRDSFFLMHQWGCALHG